MRFRLVFASVVVAVIVAQASARGDQVFDYGMVLLKKRDFAGAIKYFDQRLKSMPSDDRAMYYKALCFHYSGDRVSAKELYEQCALQFPTTPSGKLAAAAVEKMSGGLSTGLTPTSKRPAAVPSTASALPNSTHGNIPKETRVYFRMDRNSIMIPVKINGRAFDFCFDTGAHSVLVKKEDFDKAQLHIPEKAKTQESGGIGGKIESKVFDADVTVGSITRRVPISVTDDHTPDNLLGQTWLGDLEYEFDHKSNYITFRPPRAADTATASKDGFVVPFTLRGKHIIVEVTVPGGRKTRMMVDTGAEGIMLSQKNFDDLGLTIPIASRQSESSGVGDAKRKGWDFVVDELRLGNIIVRDTEVSVVEDSEEDKDDIGLLGMTFFGGWRYTIDRKNQVLRFFH